MNTLNSRKKMLTNARSGYLMISAMVPMSLNRHTAIIITPVSLVISYSAPIYRDPPEAIMSKLVLHLAFTQPADRRTAAKPGSEVVG